MVLAARLLAPAAAQAAGQPGIAAVWSTEVAATSARLAAEVNPNGSEATYHFNYITAAAYQANLDAGREGFAAAAKAPAGADPTIGFGTTPRLVQQLLGALLPETTYRYRVVSRNSLGTETSSPHFFTTQGAGAANVLLDGRGWEMVSPIDKNGGAVQGAGQTFGGGVLQAAASGEAVTYSSLASFGESAQGAPTASQYVSRRSAAGWSTQNITAPALSGSYGDHPNGAPYQLFSEDLARGLMLNGVHCRGDGSGCPVANPPLLESGAPTGYQDYYLRDSETGAFSALITLTNSPSLTESADRFNLAFAGASSDLRHVILSTCAALTPDATEVPNGGGGCEPAETNLYEWSGGALNLLNGPASHHAQLAARAAAISTDGRRVYFTDGEDSPILLYEEGQPTKFIEKTVGGVGSFQAASADGSLAFFTVGGDLYRYDALTESASEPLATEVQGVLAASQDGSRVYYLTAAGLYLWAAPGAITQVAPGAPAAFSGDHPPTIGTARISPDGAHLAFLSTASLTGYDNTDQRTGEPDSELYLYTAPSGGGQGSLICVSCNPTNERPAGPSTIPGSSPNGEGEAATDAYKPRDLSIDGGRLFFDSRDALVLQDTNNAADVYEWEAGGRGACSKPGGCVGLISSGRSSEGAAFVDASVDGRDAFFVTDGSLVPSDPGSFDLYDAREAGGFPVGETPIACEGDACQPLPPEPEDPDPGTLLPSAGNPPLRPPKAHHCKKGFARKHGRCMPKHRHHSRGGP